MATDETAADAWTTLLRQAREQDYMTFLGLQELAGPEEIQRAAQGIRATLDALHHRPLGRGEAAEDRAAALAEIGRVLADAEAVLTDPGRGPRYAAAQQPAGR